MKSALVSVNRLLEAGNRVHFEPGLRKRTKIIERNGAFEVGFWVPRAPNSPTKEGSEKTGHEQPFAQQDVTK